MPEIATLPTSPLDALIENSRHVPSYLDDEPMREESPGVWTWRERRRIGVIEIDVTRCHVDVPANPGAPFLPTLGSARYDR